MNGHAVERISAYLVPGAFDDAPERLQANARKAFQGSIVLGIGFTFDNVAASKGEAEPLDVMHNIINRDPRNKDRIFPYIGGEEISNEPRQSHRRFVIDFADFPLRRDPNLPSWSALTQENKAAVIRGGEVPIDYPNEVASDWPELISIVETRVKPERDKDARPARRLRWWRFGDRQSGLYANLEGFHEASVIVLYSPHLTISKVPARMVFSHKLGVMSASDQGVCVLQSRIHEVWAWALSATLGDTTLAYALTDVFGTLPFPRSYNDHGELASLGKAYHDHRAALMVAANEGMTKTYNRFHKAEERGAAIERLRELHDAMDRAVLRAYGWDDLADTLRPVFLTPETEDDHTYQTRYFWPAEGRDQVLARLLALNAQRHSEEVAAGIAPKGRGKAKNEETDTEDLLDG